MRCVQPTWQGTSVLAVPRAIERNDRGHRPRSMVEATNCPHCSRRIRFIRRDWRMTQPPTHRFHHRPAVRVVASTSGFTDRAEARDEKIERSRGTATTVRANSRTSCASERSASHVTDHLLCLFNAGRSEFKRQTSCLSGRKTMNGSPRSGSRPSSCIGWACRRERQRADAERVEGVATRMPSRTRCPASQARVDTRR